VGMRQHYKRSNLFLVRLWSRDSNDGSKAGGDSGQVQWQGKVQRVVDGEAHQFTSLQGLVDWLLIMLDDNKEG
jgi:hypothetical protein